MSDDLICFRGVSRTFGTGARAVVALYDVSCVVKPGARIAVVGPSGSGKSTLIHLLAGIDEPTEGTVDRAGSLADQAAGGVGVVFQAPSLVPALTAQENVALPLVLQGRPNAAAQADALDAMQLVGVHPLANQLPEELSGGQAQRVAAARVLVLRPQVILADEPTGRLDQRSGQAVLDALLKTADEVDAALLVATHDPHVTERLATIWRMTDGRLQVLEDAAAGGAR